MIKDPHVVSLIVQAVFCFFLACSVMYIVSHRANYHDDVKGAFPHYRFVTRIFFVRSVCVTGADYHQVEHSAWHVLGDRFDGGWMETRMASFDSWTKVERPEPKTTTVEAKAS
jgi:hypothetical protein